MHRLILTLFAIFSLVNISSAQPEAVWLHSYHNDNYDCFWDIYPPEEGGYIMCGRTQDDNRSHNHGAQMWVVRIDEDGDEIWNRTYGDPNDRDEGNTIVEIADGGFLIGGQTGVYHENHRVAAWRIDADGEEVWFRDYGMGVCHAVIELKSGEFLLTGGSYGGGVGFLKCLDGDGEILWERNYNSGAFRGMRETQGGVVLAGNNGNWDLWIVKASIEQEGEIIWNRQYSPYIENMVYAIVSAQDDGFLVSGRSLERDLDDNRIQSFMTFKIDDDGNQEWFRNYNISNQTNSEWCYCLEKYPRYGYILVGNVGGWERGGVIRITELGASRWNRIYDQFREPDGDLFFTVTTFQSVIMDQDGSAVATGWGTGINGENRNGFVLKLEPDILEPQFIFYSPQDTLFTVLQGDTIQFIARAFDAQEDEIEYLWTMGEDTLSIDTTAAVPFEEMGEFEVQCRISDGEFTVGITWHVSVVEWYLDLFQPDSTNLTIRRGTSLDFTHQIRALEGLDFNYSWTHTGRGGDFEIEGTDSIRYQFDLSGEHEITASVTCNDETEDIEWNINVQSIIWWWWPHDNELTVVEDTLMEFVVTPFDEQSDSIAYRWELDGQIVGEEGLIELAFPDAGQRELIAYVTEGEEADTVRWEIEIQERSFAEESTDLPTTLVLYPAYPNPFNSSTLLAYYLPESRNVQVALYDLDGRLVEIIDRGVRSPGQHEIILTAERLTSGLYLVKLTTGRESMNQKILMLK